MSRVDELIAKHCPGGVDFTSLGGIAAYSATRVDASTLDGTSFVGVDNLLPNAAGKVDATYLPNTARLTAYEIGDILLGNIRPYLKKVWLATNNGGCSGDVLAVRIDETFRSTLLSTFLYYLLSSDTFFAYSTQHARGAKMPRGSKDAILHYRVPVPPLAIQREIVKVLDTFTELDAELEAELEARRAQYDYYRDALLTFNGVAGASEGSKQALRWRALGDVATVVRGGSPRPIQSYLTDADDGVNWIKIGDVERGGKFITRTAEKIKPEGVRRSRVVRVGDFVLSNSMSFGRPYILKLDGCIHDGWLAISDFAEYYLPDFLYHLLRSSAVYGAMSQRASSGTVSNLNAAIVKSLVLPVPTLEAQARIVDILDKFDALVNDISIGLPAEITARRQQYEYYRDRLLTFKEVA